MPAGCSVPTAKQGLQIYPPYGMLDWSFGDVTNRIANVKLRFLQTFVFSRRMKLPIGNYLPKENDRMKETAKRKITGGLVLLASFALFTWLVLVVDVKPLGVNGTSIGLSTVNTFFHSACGVHMGLYVVTDWAGLVPIAVAFSFAVLGLVQLIQRKSFFKVDTDILILGVYYCVVAAVYLVFERLPINYRPILINGFMEVSYPSSTTLLVMGIMPTLSEQVGRRCKVPRLKGTVNILTVGFSAFLVVGRLLSGVHWLTDILGAALVSAGLFSLYQGCVLLCGKQK